MADRYRAFNAPVELHRGVSRRYRGSLYLKADGGDTVLGRPTSTLAKGSAANYNNYNTLICAVGSVDGTYTLDVPCTWETQNPAVFVIGFTADVIEELFEAEGELGGFVWSVKARQSTIDELLVAHGPVILHQSALRPGSLAVALST